jgi:phospholipid/cholesterol/gamma-HCH transport system substrate-binding protein
VNRARARAVVRRILFRNVVSFVSMIGLFLLAAYTTLYILDHQNLRLPVLDEKAWTLRAEFTTAQAVVPGQGQTIRVSGIRIGDVTGVSLRDGRALVTFAIDQRYRRLIHRDATALLRPKTGLKDMFVELDPGRAGPPVGDAFTIPVANTLPDVNTDEVLASLDGETRDYLRLLLQGLGEGLHRRGDTLGEVMRRLEPTHRDLRRVAAAVARRHRNLRRVIDHLARLNGELAGHDGELARLVSQSAVVFRAFASEERNISGTVARFPAALHETTRTLGKVQRLAGELRPAAARLRPAVRALTAANAAITPAALAVTPVVRDEVRPFARAAQPLVRDLRGPSAKLADAAPDFTRLGVALNHTLNLFAFNPNGREGPDKPSRDEGYLFWFAWLAHQSVNIFSTSDAHGTMRPIALAGTCNTLNSYVAAQPQMEFLLNLTPILGSACGGKKPVG